MGIELLPSVLTSGWASGVNAYAAVLVLGLMSRFGGAEAIPAGLGNTWVLSIAGGLFLVEMVADKVPYVDSIWDGIHTFIRPVVGAGLGYLLAKDVGGYEAVAATLGGGAVALASHGVKSTSRAAINTSPEPVTNIAMSTAEDVAVVGILALAVSHPWIAATICIALLLAGAAVIWYVINRVRSYRERRRQRKLSFGEVLRQRIVLEDEPDASARREQT